MTVAIENAVTQNPPPRVVVNPSDEELRRAESDGVWEYANGRLEEKVMAYKSVKVAMRIGTMLSNVADESGAGEALIEMSYRCYASDPKKFTRPDVSFVRADRLPADADKLSSFPMPADLAVEVVSPSDRAEALDEKVEDYLDAGFAVVWVVSPKVRTVRIHRADRSVALLHADVEITGENFLPAFRCKVGAFFE